MSKPKTFADDVLLVLGAGASKGALMRQVEPRSSLKMGKLPSGDNFFHDLFLRNKMGFVNMLGLMYEGLNDFIVHAWGLKNNKKHFEAEEWKKINIEEVFSFLDVGERMYAKNTSDYRAFKNFKSSLGQFIRVAISMRSDGVYCQHLMKVFSMLKSTDSILSFNWDTVSDFTLQQSKISAYNGYLDLMNSESKPLSNFIRRGALLKLHGSVNWIVCPTVKCPLYNKVRLAVQNEKLLRHMKRHKCPECKNEGEPFIIPPTSQKFIRRNTFVHKLWLLAREKLLYCKKIIFIGYSFPLTDFYSEWLFRQIFFRVSTHHEEKELPEIVVVNPEIMKKKSLVSRQYQRIFRGCTIHKFRSLENFVQKGLHLLKI